MSIDPVLRLKQELDWTPLCPGLFDEPNLLKSNEKDPVRSIQSRIHFPPNPFHYCNKYIEI